MHIEWCIKQIHHKKKIQILNRLHCGFQVIKGLGCSNSTHCKDAASIRHLCSLSNDEQPNQRDGDKLTREGHIQVHHNKLECRGKVNLF